MVLRPHCDHCDAIADAYPRWVEDAQGHIVHIHPVAPRVGDEEPCFCRGCWVELLTIYLRALAPADEVTA